MRKLVVLTLLAFGLVAAAPAVADDVTVSIGPSGFPPQISIQNGDSVTWRKVNGEHQGMIGDAVVFTVKWMKPTPQDKMQPWFDSGAKEE